MSDISSTVSGGGTGFTSYTQGDLLVGNVSTSLSKLAVSGVPNGYVLTRNNAATLGVQWSSSAVGVGAGGTGFSTYTEGDLLVGNASTTLDKLPAGSEGDVLKIVSGVPAWDAGGGSGGFTTGCKLNLASNFTFNGSVTTIPWDGADYDTDTMWSGGSASRITINTSGKYAISAALWLVPSTSSTSAVELVLRKNGTTTVSYRYLSSSSSAQAWKFITMATELDLTATDYLELRVGSSVNTTDVMASSNGHTEFIARRVG